MDGESAGIGPGACFEDKARHLRWLFRRRPPWAQLRAEYARLFPEPEISLERITSNAWTEGRELAGWTYDRQSQCWRRADGSRVLNDDGSEWAHL